MLHKVFELLLYKSSVLTNLKIEKVQKIVGKTIYKTLHLFVNSFSEIPTLSLNYNRKLTCVNLILLTWGFCIRLSTMLIF